MEKGIADIPIDNLHDQASAKNNPVVKDEDRGKFVTNVELEQDSFDEHTIITCNIDLSKAKQIGLYDDSEKCMIAVKTDSSKRGSGDARFNF